MIYPYKYKTHNLTLIHTHSSKPALITARCQSEGFNIFKINVLNSQIYLL